MTKEPTVEQEKVEGDEDGGPRPCGGIGRHREDATGDRGEYRLRISIPGRLWELEISPA